jgi:hypothetical protein
MTLQSLAPFLRQFWIAVSSASLSDARPCAAPTVMIDADMAIAAQW